MAVVDLNEDRAEETAGLITGAGEQALAMRADVGVSADVQGVIKQVVDAWGRLDVIVSDAAMMTFTPLLDTSKEAFETVLTVSLTSAFRFCKCGVPHRPQGGAVVNVSSWDNPNVKCGAETITGAIGKPGDLAAAICFLAAPEAAFITGTTLAVDGGRLCCL